MLDESVVVNRVMSGIGSAAFSGFEASLVHFTGKSRDDLVREDLGWLHKIPEGSLHLPDFGSVVIDSWQCVKKLLPSVGNAYTPALPPFSFCVPTNPVPRFLRLRANLNLYKTLNCRNIAGELRELEPYGAPTDTASGVATIGAAGQIVLPGPARLAPTPYRYAVLIERAKQLVGHAQQLEHAFLSALQQRDAESYSLLKARQDVAAARAGLKLQDLRIREAEDAVDLAETQLERSQIQFDHYYWLVDEGLSFAEWAHLKMLEGIAASQYAMAAALAGIDVSASLQATLGAAQTFANLWKLSTEYNRRLEEWKFQMSLAEQDLRIGRQQIVLAEDRVRIVGQERAIAELQTMHASAVVDFLSTKFTNAELYSLEEQRFGGGLALLSPTGHRPGATGVDPACLREAGDIPTVYPGRLLGSAERFRSATNRRRRAGPARIDRVSPFVAGHFSARPIRFPNRKAEREAKQNNLALAAFPRRVPGFP